MKKLCAIVLALSLALAATVISVNAADIDDPIGDSVAPIVVQE